MRPDGPAIEASCSDLGRTGWCDLITPHTTSRDVAKGMRASMRNAITPSALDTCRTPDALRWRCRWSSAGQASRPNTPM